MTLRVDRTTFPAIYLELRAFPRRRAKGTARCRALTNRIGSGYRAKLDDISQGGVGLLVQGSFNPGTTVEVVMTPVIDRGQVCRRAIVRWLSAEPNGWFRIGCEWENRLSFAEMQKFI